MPAKDNQPKVVETTITLRVKCGGCRAQFHYERNRRSKIRIIAFAAKCPYCGHTTRGIVTV